MWGWDPCATNVRAGLFSNSFSLECTSTGTITTGDDEPTGLQSGEQPGIVQPIPTSMDLGGGRNGGSTFSAERRQVGVVMGLWILWWVVREIGLG